MIQRFATSEGHGLLFAAALAWMVPAAEAFGFNVDRSMFEHPAPPQMWVRMTTTPPPMPKGPNPLVIWVEAGTSPLPTTPPLYEQCYGCNCLVAFPGALAPGGSFADKYTCHGGPATARVPEFRWATENGKTLSKDKACPSCQTYAVTVVDLDYPNGQGEANNDVQSMFWAVNIPGDWTELTEANAFQEGEEGNIVTVSRNSQGDLGMEPICPKKGMHRFRVTLFALSSMIGSAETPVDPLSSYDSILGIIEARELARNSFYVTLTAPGRQPTNFLQRTLEAAQGMA